ncbi:MAG: glycosyltransferase family 4 protein [Proteobacteria bacterium]|nr:glycosyltransferase family 4 protein [Pseudomonadota bacterium]
MSPAPPRLVFVVVEDWFFASHFLGFARAAVAAGFAVTVVTRVRDHRAAIEATGARVIPLEANRKSLNPLAMAAQVLRLGAILKAERPDILHLIGLKPIAVGAPAARLAGVHRRVAALTGLGFVGAGQDGKARLARCIVRRLVRPLADGHATRFLFENRTDPVTLGFDPGDTAKVTIIGGAGVDPDALRPAPLPPTPPLRVAMIARMLWSKGVDLAVEAVTRARTRGLDVTLSLYGAPDPGNPKAVERATLEAWSERPGIRWHGPTRDIASVWAAHHVAIQPSRGGEGLPRTLLESAACGRAMLTTDVPGCRDLVRNGIEGFIVPPDDTDALADALERLARNPDLVAALGAAARSRLIEGGFTETAVTDAVIALYRAMLAEPTR